jgi:acylglycerol lipase
MIMFHGFSDHMDRYYDFFPTLARAGIAVHGIDQRGWGRSVKKPSQRGLTGPTTRVVADMAAFVQSQLPSDVPVFVLGHSMGGGQVLTLASTAAYDESVIRHVRGWILEAPFIGFTAEEEPSGLMVRSGRMAGRLLPHFRLVRAIAPEKLSRDPAVVASIKADDLMHDTGTLEGLAGLLDRTAALSGGAIHLRPGVRSLVLMHGDADRVCSFDKARQWFDRQTALPDGEFRTFAGFYHQLHADTGRETFYEAVRDWILARCGEDDKAATAGSQPARAEGNPESKL